MRITRKGTTPITGTLNDDYGSMLYLYLKDRERTYHTGDWTVSDNRIAVRLSTIEGRRDRAEFKGALEGKRLILACSNPGMYGHKVEYRMKRDLEETDGDIVSQYRLAREENIEGQNLRLEYTLILRTNSEAEMRVICEQEHGNGSSVGTVFGSLATHYLQDGLTRVVHKGTWKRNDNAISITLTEIAGRRDRAEFNGSITSEKVELDCNNRGMYGTTKLVMQRDGINTIDPGSTSK